jgi:pyruvate kinase
MTRSMICSSNLLSSDSITSKLVNTVRKTRIVSTLGPASTTKEDLKNLLRAGADVFRLNYSHGSPEDKTELYSIIRELENELGQPTCILADLPGPKIRIGILEQEVFLSHGSTISLHIGQSQIEGEFNGLLPVEIDGIEDQIKKGSSILIADGLVELTVDSTEGKLIQCIVKNEGYVSSGKGLNFPGTHLDIPAFGPKDVLALEHALKCEADYVAVSYVRSAKDLIPVKDYIKKSGVHTPIIAKIEHPLALKNLDEILDYCQAVMVARGDLGVEIPLEDVPIAQEQIISKAIERGMVSIVATQMLETMTANPRPTRAEVTDVSSAIRQGASCVMLSGETAVGAHPSLAVETMARIALSTEQSFASTGNRPTALARFRSTRAIAHAGVLLAEISGAARIVVATEHGNAPRLVAGYRPEVPVTAVSNRIRALRRTCMLSGVDTVMVEEYERGSATMKAAIEALVADGRLKPGDKVIAMSGSPKAITGSTSTLRLYSILGDGTVKTDE